MGISKHDQIAKRIADKKGAEYHSDKGVDIKTGTQAIEVEIDSATFKHGVRQLQGTIKTRYLAVPNKAVKDALEYTKGTGVGVMNEYGKIKKRGS